MAWLTGKTMSLFGLLWVVGFSPIAAIAESPKNLDLSLQGQLSGWTRHFHRDGTWEHRSGLRYLPGIRIERSLPDASALDLEVTANAVAAAGFGTGDDTWDVDTYRAALRYTTPQTDTILGLQKIAFGPTRLLRPLRWFDRIDPTDPVQFTEGVYALRFRYNTLGNATAWLWCLMFNEDAKGNELLGSVGDRPEWGGRFQLPALGGDLAATVHFRRVDGSALAMGDFDERRYALDGRWDAGVGIWFEGVLEEGASSRYTFKWTKSVALGVDYTFDLGNGLYALLEHMTTAGSKEARGWDEDRSVSAALLDYPVNVMDTVKAYGIYQWETGRLGGYLNFQRTYDNVIISVGLFDYPGTGISQGGSTFDTAASGSGGEIVFIFNH